MRRILFIAWVVLVCGSFAMAQDYAKGELGAGYNYLHIDTGGAPGVDNSLPGGFFVDGTYYFAKIIGVTGDFEYNKHTFAAGELGEASVDASFLSFHAGPRVKVRRGRLEPFAHTLFGVTRISASSAGASLSDTAFSMKIGGGLDVAVVRHIALRLGEFNYYLTRFGKGSNTDFNGQNQQNNFTFGVGIVLR